MVYSLRRSGFTEHHICAAGTGSQGRADVFRVMNWKRQDFALTSLVKPQQIISAIYIIASSAKCHICSSLANTFVVEVIINI